MSCPLWKSVKAPSQVVVFQAERQTSGSAYALTLDGFGAAGGRCRRP